jgi:Thioredoxin-like [2Fe-2S] ferredoxin
MLQGAEETSFEYEGRFGGFFRDFFGNSRMVLQTRDEELFLGITRPLHTRLSNLLSPGQEIVVAGNNFPGTRVTQLVSHAWITGRPVFAHCIRVCSNKNCWRAGGKAIWDVLNRGVAEFKLRHSLRLETADCFDNCKLGPNLECDGSLIEHCTTEKGVELLKGLSSPVPANQQNSGRDLSYLQISHEHCR